MGSCVSRPAKCAPFTHPEGKESTVKIQTSPPRHVGTRRIRDLASKLHVIIPDAVAPAFYEPAIHIKSDVSRASISKALQSSVVFDNLAHGQLVAIVDAMIEQHVAVNEVLIEQGASGDAFFVVQSGHFAIYVSGVRVGYAKAGDSFGELAMLSNEPRAARLVATAPSVCWRLDRKAFRHLITSSGNEQLETRKSELARVKILRGLPEAHLYKLAMHTAVETHKAGKRIIAKGDIGDKFYMLKRGSVLCRAIGKADQYHSMADVELPEGTHFGERAFTHREPRACDVYAKTEVECFVLSGHDFEALLGSLSEQLAVVEAVNATLAIPDIDKSVWNNDSLFQRFTKLEPREGNIVAKDTSKTEAFFVVGSGYLSIERIGGTGTKTVQLLGRGEFIGEHTLRKPAVDGAQSAARTAYEARSGPGECVLYRLKTTEMTEGRRMSFVNCAVTKKRGGPEYETLDIRGTLGTGTFGRVKLAVDRAGEAYALKMLSKANMVKSEQTAYILYELMILTKLEHPFVLELYRTYQSRDVCYFLLEFIQGGELFSYIDNGIDEKEVSWFAANVVDAFSHIHSRSIVFRDLKPENVLIDAQGFARVVDFGFAKVIKAEKQTFTILGTPEYLSPECVLGQGYRFDVDLWAFGVLCYEMLLGYSPFSPDDPDDTMAVFQLVCTGTVKIPSSVSKPHRDFVLQLLMRNRNQRLGFAKGAEGIKLNPVFKDFNLPLGWDMLRQKKLKAPYKPTLRSKTDTSAFDTYDEECNLPVYLGDQEPFKEFGAVLVDDTSQIGKQPNV